MSVRKSCILRVTGSILSFDLNLQQELQDTVNEALAGYTEVNDEGVYALQSAAVCIDNDNGYVRAIVGGRSQDFSGYTLNRAFQSYRQPAVPLSR